MVNEKYNQMIGICEEMANTAADSQIAEQIAHAKQMIETAHVPTVALVGMGSVGNSLIKAAGDICNQDMPVIMNNAFAKGPLCLMLEDGDAESLYRVTAEGRIQIENAETRPTEITDVDELVCKVPCDELKNKNVILCGDVHNHDNWVQLFEHSDVIALRVNATAAMNQVERGWIDKELIPLFGKNHCAIWVDQMNLLNTEEDQADVLALVNKTLQKRGLEIPVFVAAAEVGAWMKNELESMNVQEQYMHRLMKICLSVVDSRITEIQKAEALDEKSIRNAIFALESQRSNLELAGRIAAESTVMNTYEKLKSDAKAGVRDFNLQAVDSICKKVTDASSDELETLEPKIQTYLRKVWERYQQEMNLKLNAETEKCYATLMERMEQDAAKLISDMDEQTQRILQEAINRPVTEHGGRLVRPDWEYQGTNHLTKLKVETRNMMLLAIPLVFTSPVLAIATFFGAKKYRAVQTEKRGNEFRDAMKAQIRTSCEEVVESICDEVSRNFDSVAAETADAVKQAYNGLTDRMIEQLKELAAEQKALVAKIEALKHMQTVTIPSLNCSL